MKRAVSVLVGFGLAAACLGQTWQSGPATGFRYTRFDGEYFPSTGKVYFLGGRLSNSNTDGSIWSYDPVAQTYADVGLDMIKPISNYDICYLRDDFDLAAGDTYGLYIVAGRLNSGAYTDSIQVYYPVSNTPWVLTSDPYPCRVSGQPPTGGAYVVAANKLYAFGGFESSTTVTSEAWVFDPLAAPGTRWTQLPSMNRGRCYRMGAVVDSFVYAIGGDTFYSNYLYARAECERMNTNNTGAGWTNIASLPKVCGEARAFGFDSDAPYDFQNEIVVAGRGTWPSESAHCFIYDCAANTWNTFPNLIQARRNHAGALIPGTQGGNGIPGMWVWGGRQVNDTTVLTSCEYYQLQSVGVNEERGARKFLAIAPNPSRGQVRVRCELPVQGEAALTLFDVLGKPVLSSESDQGQFSIRGLAAGVYLVRVEAGGLKEERKLVVLR